MEKGQILKEGTYKGKRFNFNFDQLDFNYT